MITIICRQRLPKGAIFYHEPAHMQFTGAVTANPDWVAADCITLQTNDQLHIIPKRDIVGLPPTLSTTQTYAMYGSKGDVYTLTVANNLWSCTCRGYEFRRDCRHIRETKNQMETDND